MRVLQGLPAGMPDRRRHGEDEDRGAGRARATGTACRCANGWSRTCRATPRSPRACAGLANVRNASPLLRRLGERARHRRRTPPAGMAARSVPRRRSGCAAPAARRGHAAGRHVQPLLRAGESARRLRVLRAAGYARVMPSAAGGRPLCCGRTYLSAGNGGRAREEARRTIAAPGRRSAGHRAGAVLPVHAARRVPLAAARCGARGAGGSGDAAERVPGAGKARAGVCTALPGTAHVHGHCHQKSFGAFPAALDALAPGSGTGR